MPIRLLFALLLVACGGAGDGRPAEAAADGSDTSSRPGDASAAPLSIEDIQRWEKGMAAELAAVQEAGARLESAKTGEDTLAAVMGVQEMTTTPAGARAAGVDEERYRTVRTNLSAAVTVLAPHLGGIDTALISPAQREEMRRMSAAQLDQLKGMVPAEVAEALRPRAEALRKKAIELAGARLKGAGI